MGRIMILKTVFVPLGTT